MTAKVFRAATDDDPVLELGKHFGLGPKSSRWLHDAGVRSVADVARLGVIEVCRRMLDAGHPVAVVCAYALAGGIEGYRWDAVPASRKAQLKREFDAMKRRWKSHPNR